MNKTLGVAIPCFINTAQCKDAFKNLMEQLNSQITDDIILYIYEDGQESEWLQQYKNNNIIIEGNLVNKGVSYARNKGIDYLIDKVDYILFMDCDDRLDDNYLQKMLESCKENKYEIYESGFYINNSKTDFNVNVKRCGVCGSAIQTKIIKNNRFDEQLQIGEDTKFINNVFDLDKHKKQYVDTFYYYQLGINQDSLTMRYSNKVIDKTRN